jgi:5-methylcytosine-specific restriction enzyme A
MNRKQMATSLMIVGVALMLAMAYFFESTAGAGVGVLVAAIGFLWFILLEPGRLDRFRRPGRQETDKHRASLYRSQGQRCNYCGVRLDIKYMEVDHKVPPGKGGSNERRNLQVLCSPCNKRKGDATDAAFRRRYGLRAASEGPPATLIPQECFDRPRSVPNPRGSRQRGAQ